MSWTYTYVWFHCRKSLIPTSTIGLVSKMFTVWLKLCSVTNIVLPPRIIGSNWHSGGLKICWLKLTVTEVLIRRSYFSEHCWRKMEKCVESWLECCLYPYHLGLEPGNHYKNFNWLFYYLLIQLNGKELESLLLGLLGQLSVFLMERFFKVIQTLAILLSFTASFI